LENREDQLKEVEVSDGGNIRTRLVHWTDEAAAAERFAEAIGRVRGLMPEAEMAVISPAEIAFRCHGLEFARARQRIGIKAVFLEDVVLKVNADDLPDHQAPARWLRPKINDPVESAFEADRRFRHLRRPGV
jgi:hypothetical protein